jgi:hypothetical protein
MGECVEVNAHWGWGGGEGNLDGGIDNDDHNICA